MPHRILVVDDDPFTRDLAGTALRGQGYEVIGAGRFAQGLEAARAQRPHLMVCDVVLPDGSGIELVRALRHELPEREAPVVILMSAFSKGRVADQRRMKEEAKAAAFLTKPLMVPALLDLVAQHLPPAAEAPPGPPAAPAPKSAAAPATPTPAAPAKPAAAPPKAARPAAPAAPEPRAAAADHRPAEAAPHRADGEPASGNAPARPAGAPAGQTLLAALAGAWRGGWSGTLAVSRPQAQKTIVIEKGQVVWATSSLAEERLGRVLLRLGFLPHDQYESSLKEAAETGQRIGDVLVGRGYLTPWQRDDALVQQVEAIVIGALAWPDGSYQLAATAGKPATQDRIAVSPVPRLVLRAFLEVIPEDQLDGRLGPFAEEPLVRRPDIPAAALNQLSPTLEESQFLEALAAPLTLERILGAHPRGPQAAAPYLGALLTLGIVAPVSAPKGESALPEERPAPEARRPGAAAPAEAQGRAGVGTAPKSAPGATERVAAQAAAKRLLEAEAAFEEGRLAVEREDLAAAAKAFARAVGLCPDEGEYRAWAAWVRALEARRAFEAALDAVTREMEEAVRLTPSSEGTYDLVKRVIGLRTPTTAP